MKGRDFSIAVLPVLAVCYKKWERIFFWFPLLIIGWMCTRYRLSRNFNE